VLRGLSASAASRVGSLSAGGDDGSSDPPLDRIRALATEDAGFEHAMESDVVDRLLARLPERERRIVQLRFYEQRSQADIAAEVGVSQMQVSRLLRASFERMRSWMTDDDSPD
jgi:RNA polymerase sigma-B factor